jgi:hypothetical protein
MGESSKASAMWAPTDYVHLVLSRLNRIDDLEGEENTKSTRNTGKAWTPTDGNKQADSSSRLPFFLAPLRETSW